MAAACGAEKCWAGPGGFCKTPSGARRRPHPERVDAARRLGLTGGAGLRVLTEARQALAAGRTVRIGGTVLVLPERREAAGAG